MRLNLKQQRPQLMMIEWNDSCSERTTWTRFVELKDQPLGPSRAVTVGFVIQDNEEAISLSPSLVTHDCDETGDDDAFDYVMTIPRACITKETKLR